MLNRINEWFTARLRLIANAVLLARIADLEWLTGKLKDDLLDRRLDILELKAAVYILKSRLDAAERRDVNGNWSKRLRGRFD